MRRWTAAIQPALIATVWLLGLFAPVLSPGRALANRDIAIFHLPLRTSFRELALPVWNPWLHGGEPILSNPSYAAFYPPSWLAVAAPLPWGLSLLAILHGGIAFAGAWLLARRLGCGRGAAALAGIGFTVSLFITGLAFAEEALQTQAKTGILAGSLIAALIGAAVLRRATSRD